MKSTGPGRLLGVGVDLVEIERAGRLLDRHASGLFRFLTPSEEKMLKYARRKALAFALIFAAKEAASKSVGESLLGPGSFRRFGIGRQGNRLVVRWAGAKTSGPSGSSVRIELYPFVWKDLAGALAYSYA